MNESAEQLINPEPENFHEKVTPGVARQLAGKEYFGERPYSLSTQQKEALQAKLIDITEQDIDGTIIDKQLTTGLQEYWANQLVPADQMHFADRVKRHNTKLEKWIDRQESEGSSFERQALHDALEAVGISAESLHNKKDYPINDKEEGTKTVSLTVGVEEFRQKYLDEGSNHTQFVIDLANSCRHNGTIDSVTFTARWKALEGLRVIFGPNAELLNDFATAYVLAAQKESSAKKEIATETIKQLKEAAPIYKQFPQKDQPDDHTTEYLHADEAITPEDLNSIEKKQDEINKAFQDGEINEAERQEKMNDIINIQKGIIELHSMDEAGEMISKLVSEGVKRSEALNAVRHEGKHFEKANEIGKQLGVDLQPRIILQRVSKGDTFTYHPRTIWNFSEIADLDDALKKSINAAIIAAPAFKELSESDKYVLGLTISNTADPEVQSEIGRIQRALDEDPESPPLSQEEMLEQVLAVRHQKLQLKYDFDLRKHMG